MARPEGQYLSFLCPNCHSKDKPVEYAEALLQKEWFLKREAYTLASGLGGNLPVYAWICRRCGYTVLQVPTKSIPNRLEQNAD